MDGRSRVAVSQNGCCNSNSSNGTRMIVLIKEVERVSVEIVVVMEGNNIFPSVRQC